MDAALVMRVVFLLVSTIVVVGGIGGLGYALGRLVSRRSGPALPPDDGRRLGLLEEEVELLQDELRQLREEGEFLRLLPREDDEAGASRRETAA